MNKLLLQAFETLDYNLLDVILSDQCLCFECSKDIFILRFREYCLKIKSHADEPACYKSYPGICRFQEEGFQGFNFINENGTRYLGLSFKETAENIFELRQEFHLESPEKEQKSFFEPHFIYLDDKLQYAETAEIKLQKAVWQKAVDEIEKYSNENGVLDFNFYSCWHKKYEEYFETEDFINGEYFTFQEKFLEYFWEVHMLFVMVDNFDKARYHYVELMNIEIASPDKMISWAIKAHEDFCLFSSGFEHQVDFKQKLLIEPFFKYDFSDFSWYHNVSEIVNKYKAHLPFKSIDDFQVEYDENELETDELPF